MTKIIFVAFFATVLTDAREMLDGAPVVRAGPCDPTVNKCI